MTEVCHKDRRANMKGLPQAKFEIFGPQISIIMKYELLNKKDFVSPNQQLMKKKEKKRTAFRFL